MSNFCKGEIKSLRSPVKSIQSTVPNIIENVNSSMLRLRDHIHEFEIPDFGSGLYHSGNSSSVFHNSNTIVASVIADRIKNKFESPSRDTESQLKTQCFDGWIEFESGHLSSVEKRLTEVYRKGRGAELSLIYKARQNIEAWLFPKYYESSFWAYLSEAPIEFGPGETFVSQQGDVSTFSKLSNLDQWMCNIDNDRLTALIIASNKGLRQILIENFFKRKKYKLRSRRPAAGSKADREILFRPSKKISKKVAYFADRVYHEFLYEFPLGHPKCRVQHGSRGSSVYKDSKKRRFINIECFLSVVLQKMLGYALRQCLKKNAGIDLDLGQSYHRSLIASNSHSTIDESNASDSILLKLLERLLPDKVYNLICTLRSPFVLLPVSKVNSNGRKVVNKEYYPSKKCSSMGNGFTFELLTLTLASICRLYDKNATVYGDDIICDNESANDIVASIQSIGFIVNKKKSFINLPFRESCGGFFLENYGYIRSYDFKWNHTIADVIVTCNKLRRILTDNPNWEHPLKDSLLITYSEVLGQIPASLRGPVSPMDDIPVWVEDHRSHNAHYKSKTHRKVFDKYSIDLAQYADTLQLSTRDFQIVLVPSLTKKVKLRAIRSVKNVSLLYTYIHSGRVAEQELRQQKDEYVYTLKPVLVHQTKNKDTSLFTPRSVYENPSAIRAGAARMVIRSGCTTGSLKPEKVRIRNNLQHLSMRESALKGS